MSERKIDTGTKQGCPDDHEKRNGYEQRSRGNYKATRPTKAREPFALTGQTNTEEEKKNTGWWRLNKYKRSNSTERTAVRFEFRTHHITVIWWISIKVKLMKVR